MVGAPTKVVGHVAGVAAVVDVISGPGRPTSANAIATVSGGAQGHLVTGNRARIRRASHFRLAVPGVATGLAQLVHGFEVSLGVGRAAARDLVVGVVVVLPEGH